MDQQANQTIDDEHSFVQPPRSVVPDPVQQSGSYRKIAAFTFFSILSLGVLGMVIWSPSKSTETRTKAGYTGPSLKLLIGKKAFPVGEQTRVDVWLDTHDDVVSAASIDMRFDQTALDIVSFTPSNNFPIVLKPLTKANNHAVVVVGVQPQSPYKGSVSMGSFIVKGKAKKQTSLVLDPATIVTAVGKQTNVLASRGDVAVSVESNAQSTLSPTQHVQQTSTPSPTASQQIARNATNRANISVTSTPGSTVSVRNSPMGDSSDLPQEPISDPVMGQEPVVSDTNEYSPFSDTTVGENTAQSAGVLSGVVLFVKNILQSVLNFFRK